MNVRKATVLVTLCVLGAVANAAPGSGVIFGTLSGPGAPTASQLRLTCGQTMATATADGRGTYRITIPARGRCNLRIGNMPPPGELVFVYEEPTRYDYAVRMENGQTHIERR